MSLRAPEIVVNSVDPFKEERLARGSRMKSLLMVGQPALFLSLPDGVHTDPIVVGTIGLRDG